MFCAVFSIFTSCWSALIAPDRNTFSAACNTRGLRMAFPPQARWSVRSQGFVGVTSPSKDASPGSSPDKTTIVLGNGYAFDKAEYARVTRQQAMRQEARRTRLTQQGELRAKEAKTPPGPFDTRAKKGAGSKQKVQQQPNQESLGEAEVRSFRRSVRNAAPSIPAGEEWDPKTQGFTGRYNWLRGGA